MPTHKRDITKFSLSELRALSGHTERTIRKRLAGLEPIATDGRTVWFAARPALEAIFLGETLNPAIERAKLDRARSAEVEFRLARERAEWLPAASLDHCLISLATGVSTRMQGLPRALAVLVAAETSPPKCEKILDEAIRGALFDLSEEGRLAAERLEQPKRSARAKPRTRRAASAASPC